MRRSVILFTISIFATLALQAHAAYKALLIGIEDYPRISRNPGFSVGLPGPQNDIAHMREMLTKRYGIKPQDIKTLIDSQATHNEIKSAITGWLADGVQSGDVAILYYSGHGSSLPDENHDEADGKDEALVCNDYNPQSPSVNQFVVDDELSEWFNSITQKGAKMVFIADCCHSGTISRDIVKTSMSKYLRPSASLVKKMGGWPAAKSVITKEASQDDSSNVILLAACLDDQTSQTAMFPGGWMGAMTYKLVDYLDHVNNNPSYQELASYLQRAIPTQFCQTPQLSGPNLSDSFLECFAPVSQPVVASDNNSSLKVFLSGFGDNKASIAKVLEGCSYVQLVSDESLADRILVKKTGGQYHANFDLRDGSCEDTLSADSAAGLVKKLRPSLMRAYVWKQLAASQSEDKSLQPKVWIDSHYQKNLSIRPTAFQPVGTVVKIGESTIFQFQAEKPCYVTLIDLPTEGPLTVLFPNKYHSGRSKIAAGQKYSIPSEDMDFDIVATGPPGRDIVIAIASEEPLDLSSLNLSVVDEKTGISQSNDEDSGARLFSVRGRRNSIIPNGKFAIAYLIAEVVK